MLGGLLLILLTVAGSGSESAGAIDMSAAYARIAPSYVKVQITRRPEGQRRDEGLVPTVVSGVVVDDERHVLTVGDPLVQAHMVVVETVDRRASLARIVGIDNQSNLAVLQVDADWAAPAELGDAEALRPGHPVLGIGNPFDLGATASVGYVTGLDRWVEARGREWTGLVQVSLPVYPGEQGGPLVDREGKLVALVLTRLEGDGGQPMPINVSFALPIDAALQTARAIIDRADLLEQHREVPFLGVRAIDIVDPLVFTQARLEPGFGCVIKQVYPDTPAERAGFMTYDILKSFDGRELRGVAALGRAILDCHLTQRVRVTVVRGGDEVELEVELTVKE